MSHMGSTEPDFRLVEPERTAAGGEIHVSWTSVEDGGPTIRMWYPTPGPPPYPDPVRWTGLAFDLVLIFRYHNEHLKAEDAEPTYEPPIPGYTWTLLVATDSELKEWSVSRLTTIGPGGVPNWCGLHPSELKHYRMIHDHDGYYDIIAASVDITHTMRPKGVESIGPPPWLD